MWLDQDTTAWLKGAFPGQVKFSEPMHRHTSLRVGGPADALVTVRDAEGLSRLVTGCRERGVPYSVIGGGTNLLVRDAGIRGVVIRMLQKARTVACESPGKGRVSLTVPAGVRTQALCALAIARGLEGLNFAVGIPGTIGGAIRMNAGTRQEWMDAVLEELTVMDPEGRIHRIRRPWFRFAYRKMDWDTQAAGCSPSRAVILAGRLILRQGNQAELKRKARAVREARRQNQPTGAFCAGCFFKNPSQGPAAGELIDLAGLKGVTIGGARVSEKHANFIVNENRASAADILALVETIQEKVQRMFQVMLEPEVEILGA